MGQIWLHIGSPKTGTTSLQNFLHENQEMLRERAGVNFIEAGRDHITHNSLASEARKGETEAYFKGVLREADRMPEATHIVSSELLFNPFTTRKLTGSVPEEVRGRVKVICYLRRQDVYLEALYKQFLKNNRIPPDRDAFLKEGPQYARYLGVINAYGRGFGKENIVLRPFSREHLVNGDVIDDFAAQLGFEITDEMQRPDGFANKTFSAEMSELLASLGEHTEFKPREVIRELIAQDHPGTIRSGDVFSAAQRHQIMQSMEKENARLVADHMPEHPDFFALPDLKDADSERELSERLTDRRIAMDALMRVIGTLQRRQDAPPEPEPDEEPDGPPSWYHEIYPGGEKDGTFHKFGTHSCVFVRRDTKQLVVSFDNLSQAGNLALAREPWAQKFCQDRGYSHLGIFAQTPTWFRHAPLIAHLETLRDQGFFKQFDRVAFVGTSMGAFGALTFSSLAPGANVVAFSPQTTLDQAKTPWEARFAKGRAADWSLPYSDAAEQTATASRVYLIYDSFHSGDRAHIARLKGDNLVHLKGFGIGHKSALVLNRMGALKEVMEGGVTGTLEPETFYRLLRGRRDIFIYRQTMEGYLKDRGQPERQTRFAKAFKKRRRRLRAAESS